MNDKPDTGKLTASERKLFEKCKQDITKGFVLVGRALGIIRDQRLYREKYNTFEACVQAEFQLARREAYRYIEGAVIVENVGDSPTNGVPIPLPSNLEVTKALEGLKPGEQKKVWKEAVAKTPKGKKTSARIVKEVREELNKALGKKAKEPIAPSNGNGNGSKKVVGTFDQATYMSEALNNWEKDANLYADAGVSITWICSVTIAAAKKWMASRDKKLEVVTK